MTKKTLRNETGVALVMVLVIALISLSIVAVMLYMVTVGTRLSGYMKQFRSAEEAGYGTTQMIREFMAAKGNLDLPLFNPDGTDWKIGGACQCDANNDGSLTVDDNLDLSLTPSARSCRCDKICNPSSDPANWALCAPADISLDPTVNYDFRDVLTGEPLLLGTGQNQFSVFAKIVDTREGNTDMVSIVTGGELGGSGVVTSNAGLVDAEHYPYLYRIEVQAQRTANPVERSRLSVIYAY